MRASGNSLRIACTVSVPLMPGSRRSISVTSGRWVRYSARACSPLEASAQTTMSGSSAMMLARPIRTR